MTAIVIAVIVLAVLAFISQQIVAWWDSTTFSLTVTSTVGFELWSYLTLWDSAGNPTNLRIVRVVDRTTLRVRSV